jgi:mannose-6-phosphate isomerase-like protein (cupin superfamily)
MSSTTRDEPAAKPFVTPESDGRALWSTGALIVVRAAAATTGGAATLAELRAVPGYETPLHVHGAEDEGFYVLGGEIECLHGSDGAERARAAPHDSVFLPRGVPHGFRVAGDEPLRMVAVVTPGGLEGFFETVGTPAPTRDPPPLAEPNPEAMAEMAAVAAEYEVEILGPLPE